MDPLAHTLVGVALSESGLKRKSRYAAAALIIGVNLPDIDVVSYLWGSDTALFVRRGWSHGVLAMILLPLILSGCLWLWHRWRSDVSSKGPPFNLKSIIALSYLAILTHPLLDWLNTYGVRLLMPFDDRWFYGDTLFIVDPWVWLMLIATTLFFYLRTRGNPFLVRRGAMLGGVTGVALVAYVCMVYGSARSAEDNAAEQFATPMVSQANPILGQPFAHRMILVYEDRYRIIGADGKTYFIQREEAGPIVQQALESDAIRGFVNWMRFPYWGVEETPESWQVSLWDLRYQGPGMRSAPIGYVQVEIPK